MDSDEADDHTEESIEYKKEFTTLSKAIFNIVHGQYANGSNRVGLYVTDPQTGPQLPVLALKPDQLSFSMTPADLRI